MSPPILRASYGQYQLERTDERWDQRPIRVDSCTAPNAMWASVIPLSEAVVGGRQKWVDTRHRAAEDRQSSPPGQLRSLDYTNSRLRVQSGIT